MIRMTLSTLLLTTSLLIASCTSGLPEEAANDSNARSDDAPKPLSNSSDPESNDDSAENSVAGLWDLSDQVEEIYEYWTDNGTFVIYDYQGDGDGTGQNCYELVEVPYTREGSVFTYADETHNITRDANTLTVDGVPFPLIISFSVIDLNVCI